MTTADLDLSFMVSLFANTSISIVAVVFGIMATWLVLTKWGQLSGRAKLAAFGLWFLGLYLVLRVGYWSPTMWLSDVQSSERYHLGWIQYRWISYAPASLLGLIMLSLLMKAIFPWRDMTLVWIFLFAIVAGAAVAVTWQASELGYWFDRQAVIEAHDEWWGYER